MEQFARAETYILNWQNMLIGFCRFAVGLAKKVMIAASLAPFVTPVFDQSASGASMASGQAGSAPCVIRFSCTSTSPAMLHAMPVGTINIQIVDAMFAGDRALAGHGALGMLAVLPFAAAMAFFAPSTCEFMKRLERQTDGLALAPFWHTSLVVVAIAAYGGLKKGAGSGPRLTARPDNLSGPCDLNRRSSTKRRRGRPPNGPANRDASPAPSR